MATKRIYLKDLHRMMDGMDMELAEKVHQLFMANKMWGMFLKEIY